MSELLADLGRWAVEVVHSFGYLGVFFVVALANLHLPVPTEVTLPLAGFLVGQGRLSFLLVLAASTAGGTLVALFHYLPGYWVGEERLHRFVERYGRYVLIRHSDLDRAGKMFHRHGGAAIVIGHLVPGVGALISIPAGIYRMPILRQFTTYTIVGSALWNVGFIGLGWFFGRQWRLVEQYASVVEYPVLAVLLGGIAWFLWSRWKTRKRRKR